MLPPVAESSVAGQIPSNIYEQRALDPSDRAERPRERIARAGGSELAQDDGRRNRPRLDRRLEADQLRPLGRDRARVDCLADKGLEQWVCAGPLYCVELAVLEIFDARREPKAEQVAKAEDVVCRAGGVGVVLGDAQVGLVRVVHQAVQHVRRLTDRRGDDLSVEGVVAPGDVRVDHEPRVDAVLGVDRAAAAGASTRPEVLAVGR